MNTRDLVVPAYLASILLVAFPATDTILSTAPFKVNEIAWRFAAMGLLSRSLVTPALGMLIAFATALARKHRMALRIFAFASGLVGFLLLVITSLFVMDAFQMRVRVQPQAAATFDVVVVTALAKLGLAIVVAAAFSVAGWRAAGRETRRSRFEAAGTDLLVSAR